MGYRLLAIGFYFYPLPPSSCLGAQLFAKLYLAPYGAQAWKPILLIDVLF